MPSRTKLDKSDEMIAERRQGTGKMPDDMPRWMASTITNIDKWSKWNQNLLDKIKIVDLALVDGTFYDSKEVDYRDMSEIPHPFVVETMDLFKNETKNETSKIKFIHLNHTNPLINRTSNERKELENKGFSVGEFKELIHL